MVADAPERIFRIAESGTVDASKRLDRLVDAEIAQAKSDRTTATVFLGFFSTASVTFFALGNNIAGAVFMSVPVIGLLRTMWTSSIGRARPSVSRAKPADKDDKKDD